MVLDASLAGTRDVDGQARAADGKPDLGADESAPGTERLAAVPSRGLRAPNREATDLLGRKDSRSREAGRPFGIPIAR